MIKYCRQVLYAPSYVSKNMLMHSLHNSYEHVEKTYIMCGVNTWTYKQNMQQEYDIDFLMNIQDSFGDKIEIIFGNWITEEDQRNDALEAAKKDGFDFMFIQDADEFLSDSGFQRIKQYVLCYNQSHYYCYPWITFWRDWSMFFTKNNKPAIAYPEFLVRLDSGVKFKRKRSLNSTMHTKISMVDQDPIFHGSYVLNDEQIKTKLSCWGHANDFDTVKWYQQVWIHNKPLNGGFHPVSPREWTGFEGIKNSVYRDSIPKILRPYIEHELEWDYNDNNWRFI